MDLIIEDVHTCCRIKIERKIDIPKDVNNGEIGGLGIGIISCEVGLAQRELVSSLHQILGQFLFLERVELLYLIFDGFFGVQCTRNVGFSW